MKFHHRAVPIALSAVLIDAIGFGIVMPVLPTLIVELTQLLWPMPRGWAAICWSLMP